MHPFLTLFCLLSASHTQSTWWAVCFFPENILSHTRTVVFKYLKLFLVELKIHSLKSLCPCFHMAQKSSHSDLPLALLICDRGWSAACCHAKFIKSLFYHLSLIPIPIQQYNPERQERDRQTEEESLKTWRIRSDVLFSHRCQGLQGILLLCTSLEEKRGDAGHVLPSAPWNALSV